MPVGWQTRSGGRRHAGRLVGSSLLTVTSGRFDPAAGRFDAAAARRADLRLGGARAACVLRASGPPALRAAVGRGARAGPHVG
jgi:hypothetical protein